MFFVLDGQVSHEGKSFLSLWFSRTSLSKKLLTKVKAKPAYTAESAEEKEMDGETAESDVEANPAEPFCRCYMTSVENLKKT